MGGEIKAGGSERTPETVVAASDQAYEVAITITNSLADDFNVRTIWQNGDGGIDDFDFCWIQADKNILVQFTMDRAGTPKYAVFKVLADIPLVLSADDLLASALTDGTVETLDQIDEIKVKNDATGAVADVAAKVRVVLLT